MSDLSMWLKDLPSMGAVTDCTVTIKNVTYPAARYTQTRSTPEGSDAWCRGERTYTREMIYCLGELPKHYVRRSKAAYLMPNDSHEWYIAGYWQGGENPFAPGEDMSKHHPFGKHFLLAPWNVAGKIDDYQQYPYDRIPITVV